MAALTCASHSIGCASSSIFGNGKLKVQNRPTLRPAPALTVTVRAGRIGPGKRWEHYPTNDNGKVIMPDMHVRKGDLVQVIAGDDKGKIGKVTDILTKISMVVVEGVNIKTKHVAPKTKDESGQIIQRERPIHSSNVMLYSQDKQVRSRVGYKISPTTGKKVRYLVKTGELLE